MKTFFLNLFAFCTLSFAVISCNDDFDPTGDFVETPVVYGLIDHTASVNYIRIERAFLDKKTSALTLAKDTNSLYFKNLAVTLQELNASGNVVSAFPLVRVNGALETPAMPRDTGVFSNTPNYLYKTNAVLKAATRYRLSVRTAENKTFTAETTTLQPFDITSPARDVSQVKFLPNSTTPISWTPPENTNTNAKIYDLNIRIRIEERDANGVMTPKFYDWKSYKNLKQTKGRNDITQLIGDGNAFYVALKTLIPKNSTTVSRCSRSVKVVFEVTAGGSELEQYINSSITSTSIASTDAVYKYTNINGGKGVFSSKFTQRSIEFELTDESVEQLFVNAATRNLGFTARTASCN
jgi:hypothetical protein